MESSSQLPHFVETGRIAGWLTSLLGLLMALHLVDIVINAAELVLVSRYPDAVQAALSNEDIDFTVMPGGMLQLGISLVALPTGLLTAFAYVATIVVFLVWMRRSYMNLKALGVRGVEYSPRWAVVCWFVPFVNLVRPYTIIKEIWTRSDPANLDMQGLPLPYTMQHASQAAPLFGMWWAFWIIDNMVANILFRVSLRATTLKDNIGMFWLSILSAALSATAAFLAIKVVRAITARQQERHDRQKASQTQINDPPPIAGYATP